LHKRTHIRDTVQQVVLILLGVGTVAFFGFMAPA